VNRNNGQRGEAAGRRVRVLIVDNHRLVSEALSAMLADQPDIHVVGSASSRAEAMARVTAFSPDVAIVDYHLADGTGVPVAEALRALSPDIRILFISRSDGDMVRLQALEAGASGFIHKSRAATDIVSAIRTVASGRVLFTPEEMSSLLSLRRQLSKLEPLTDREMDVLRLLRSGRDSRDIAKDLGMAYATLRVHLRAIEQKLGAHDKIGALTRARELGLID